MSETQAQTAHKTKKTLHGVVVSVSSKDTAKVRVERYVKHPKYKKYFTKTTHYLAHDPGNTHGVGEKVILEECAPVSKRKHFRIV